MRKILLVFLLMFYCIADGNAQVFVDPVFDRTDIYEFRVEKVELTKDTTYIYCTYCADEQSWAYISDSTYIENVQDGSRYPIIKVTGIPFGPDKKYFENSEKIQVVLYFPHISAEKINLIENENVKAFNIYGIDLNNSYDTSYTSENIYFFFNSAQKKEEIEDWSSALEYTFKQLDASNYVEGIRSYASACSMYNLTMEYFRTMEYDKVIEWGKKALDILQTLPQDSAYLDVLARAYGNVSSAYHMLEQHDIAEQYMELSLATRRLKDGVGTLNYEEYLMRMANEYFYKENYPKALLYGLEVVDIYEKKYIESPYKYECVYINSLNNLCEYYLRMGKTEEAVNIGKQTLELSNQGRCDAYPWIKYYVYNNLGNALLNNGQTDEGIELLETIIKESKNEDYSAKWNWSTRLLLAHTYLNNKKDTLRALQGYEALLKEIEDSMSHGKKDYYNYSTVLKAIYKIKRWSNTNIAMQYLEKAINVQKEWNGENSIAYANMLLNKVEYIWVSSLSENKNIDSLLLYTEQTADIIKRHMNNAAFYMSKDERKAYWQRYKELFTWFIPTISGIVNTNIGNSLAYDAALFFKGMLLSSEKEFKSIIQETNDDELNNLFLNYSNNLTTLEKFYSDSPVEYNIDSLKYIIHNQEYLLSQKVTRFNHHYKGTNYTWKEIKNQLKQDDVAIEILSYQSIDGQDIYYDAYTIRSDSKTPQLIPLCSEAKLISLITDSIDYKGLSILLWGNAKLHDAIKDAKNIYFSTSGLLNTIGIEYLPITDNQYIYDRFNLYRLSSTRELCMRSDTMSVDNAYLYGGLDYNSIAEQPKYKEAIPYRLSRSAVEALTHRGGFDLLMGSMQEVELIKSIMSKHKIECVILSGSAGTEESIKNLSGSHLCILHLSTHGMYVSEEYESVRTNNNYRFIISDEAPNVAEEEISLSRSFLVMSGGNALIHRDSIPDENEDGILTALEISHLDFTNLDLVVLSACETALGIIDSEGVYGLQRGFKKAGANTILMSLDKVDDEATRILMVEFYRNLMAGKSKHQSFKEAQKQLRQVENGKYDDPKFWASFIMLDGLN